MKYKLYSFYRDKLAGLSEKATFLSDYELIENQDLSIEELLKKKYHAIEFDAIDYEKFSPHIKMLDWKTNAISVADTLILFNGQYRPHNLLPEAIMKVIGKNIDRINSHRPVIIIGEVKFVTSVVSKMAESGFINIIVSLLDYEEAIYDEFYKRIRAFTFKTNIKYIPVQDLTSSELDAYMLISNFKKEKNKEAYELLAYFNFLSEGAIFIDCNSINDAFLVEDAKKADVFVIDEVELLELKYNKLLELLKISP